MEILGVDITHQGIRGCILDTESGETLSKVKSAPALESTAPHKVLAQMHTLVCKWFQWNGPVGCAFPAPIHNGYILSGGKVDQSWIDANAEQLFSEITDNPFHVINNTDASGLAEMKFGAGHDEAGVAIMLALDIFFGSSLFMNGKLVPNTEMGRMTIDDNKIEDNLAAIASGELSTETSGSLIQTVLEHLEKVFHPNLFILGGKLSEEAEKIFPFIKVNTPFKASDYDGQAQIVGACLYAETHYR